MLHLSHCFCRSWKSWRSILRTCVCDSEIVSILRSIISKCSFNSECISTSLCFIDSNRLIIWSWWWRLENNSRILVRITLSIHLKRDYITITGASITQEWQIKGLSRSCTSALNNIIIVSFLITRLDFLTSRSWSIRACKGNCRAFFIFFTIIWVKTSAISIITRWSFQITTCIIYRFTTINIVATITSRIDSLSATPNAIIIITRWNFIAKAIVEHCFYLVVFYFDLKEFTPNVLAEHLWSSNIIFILSIL